MNTLNHAAVLACALGATATAAFAAPVYLPTNIGNGADAEVRESTPTQNRGASTELATRVLDLWLPSSQNDVNDRNSVIYLQFDLAALDAFSTTGSILRMTVRNNLLNEDRVHDTDGLFADFGRNGMQYYGIPGAVFNEDLITYNTAPGITPDGDVGTKDFNGSAMLLGEQDLPAIGSQNHLPVGSNFDFASAALDAFLETERATNRGGVAVIAVVHRNLGLIASQNSDKSGEEPSTWANLNYLFNPKEQTTLNADPNYDADINDPGNPLGSPWGGADNSNGEFSPQLVFVPAPCTAALLGGALMITRRKR